MRDRTKSKLIVFATVGIMIFLMVVMLIGTCKKPKAEELEIFINEYPFWAVTTSGDSTFQTVLISKCWQTFPNGQRERLGYKVTVDSSGIRIYEEKPEWFLRQTVIRALSLRNDLTKVKQKGD